MKEENFGYKIRLVVIFIILLFIMGFVELGFNNQTIVINSILSIVLGFMLYAWFQ